MLGLLIQLGSVLCKSGARVPGTWGIGNGAGGGAHLGVRVPGPGAGARVRGSVGHRCVGADVVGIRARIGRPPKPLESEAKGAGAGGARLLPSVKAAWLASAAKPKAKPKAKA